MYLFRLCGAIAGLLMIMEENRRRPNTEVNKTKENGAQNEEVRAKSLILNAGSNFVNARKSLYAVNDFGNSCVICISLF